MTLLGQPLPRLEDRQFVTRGARYTDDLDVPGAAHLTFVRSTMAHARIASVDAAGAADAPGVVAVFTGEDVDLPPILPEVIILNQAMGQPVVAKDVVRYVGEVVAVVVTEERYQGPDAAEQVWVDYDPLPAVVDPEAALSGDVLLFPEAGTNVALELNFGADDSLFEGCDVVVRRRIVNQRVAPCPLEVRAGVARWDDDGTLTYWGSSQGAHTWRDEIAKGLGVDPGLVRFVAPDVGGAFGSKIHAYPEDVLAAWVARRLGRPVRWQETRSESMVATGHGRGQVQYVELGGTRDGKLLAYRLDIVQDSGAYPRIGAALPFMTRMMVNGVYDIPRAECNSRSVVTNTTPVVAYRGAGRPEAAAAIERAVDLFAAEIGMDPVDVRRRNLVAADRFPYTSPVATVYDSGDYERALDMALDAAGYDELRAEQRRRREAGAPKQLGIGLSTYVEVTGAVGGDEFGAVEVRADGRVVARVGTSSHGQGHRTAFSQLVADRLGVDLDQIDFVQADTAAVPVGQGTSGSRSVQHGGTALHRATLAAIEKGKEVAAGLLGVPAGEVVFDPGGRRFYAEGAPDAARSWAEVAEAAGGSVSGEHTYRPDGPSFPFGAHVAVVEVDTETGKVTLTRMVAVDDAGRLVNPLVAEGQVHGGLAQGIAQALLEEFRYDDEGNPVTSNLADYAFISATELPSFETLHMETPSPVNDLGAKGIGESGTIGGAPAVQNAVVDALSHLGVRHVDMPTTAERVWRAIQEGDGGGASSAPARRPAAAGTGSVDTTGLEGIGA